MLLYFPDLAKAYIHGHYRLNPKTHMRVWVDSYQDKRPERERSKTQFESEVHRITHFQHYLGRNKTREALHAFHDLNHEDAHQLARHLGLAGDDKGADKKALMESLHGRIQEQRRELTARGPGDKAKDAAFAQREKERKRKVGEGQTVQDVPTKGEKLPVADLLRVATAPGRSGNTAYSVYRAVTPEEAAQAQRESGSDLTGFVHGLDEAAVRHVLQEHGDPQREAARGQEAITLADLALIGDVTDPAKADVVRYGGKTAEGLDAIRYEKRVNGSILVVEEVRTGRKRLALKTMWKTRAAPVAQPGGGSPHTSATFGARSPHGSPSVGQGGAGDKPATPPAEKPEAKAPQAAAIAADFAKERAPALQAHQDRLTPDVAAEAFQNWWNANRGKYSTGLDIRQHMALAKDAKAQAWGALSGEIKRLDADDEKASRERMAASVAKDKAAQEAGKQESARFAAEQEEEQSKARKAREKSSIDKMREALPILYADLQRDKREGRFSKEFIAAEMAKIEKRARELGVELPGQNKFQPAPHDSAAKFHEAKLNDIASRRNVDMAKVKRLYDTEAGREGSANDWVASVRDAAKAGVPLSRTVLDNLDKLRPGAVQSLRHDFPAAKFPEGYQLPAARKADKARIEERRAAKRAGRKKFDAEYSVSMAADSIKTLRRSDVYRVIFQAGASTTDDRHQVAKYIIQHRPDLRDEVHDVLDDEGISMHKSLLFIRYTP